MLRRFALSRTTMTRSLIGSYPTEPPGDSPKKEMDYLYSTRDPRPKTNPIRKP